MKVLFVPLISAGHINAGIGLAQILRDRGHNIKYVVDSSHRVLVSRYGFGSIIIDNPLWTSDRLSEWEANLFTDLKLMEKYNTFWHIKQFFSIFTKLKLVGKMLVNFFFKDWKLVRIIADYKPDIIIIDDIFCYPSLMYSGIPWIYMCSSNPLSFYSDPGVPTYYNGVLIEDNFQSRVLLRSMNNFFIAIYSVLFFMRGYGLNWEGRHIPNSPYYNFYCYPKELDYYSMNPFVKNSFRIETTIRQSDLGTSPVTGALRQFLDSRGEKKVIFVSMGSIISADIKFMKNMIKVLSKLDHMFIVSTGLYHEQFDLAHNMYGDQYLPQRQLLPEVDLVVTHGGNNTVVETFTYGKPMIIIPVWFDQQSNAERLQELGFGIHIDLQAEDMATKLPGAIETLINDNELKTKMSLISQRIKRSDSLEVAVKMIESVV